MHFTKLFLSLFLLLSASVGLSALSFCSEDSTRRESVRDNPDYKAQLLTISHMRAISDAAEAYRMDHNGQPVENLVDLFVDEIYLFDNEEVRGYLYDGWGRKLYYYTNGKTYALISFGKNGVPDSQISCGGCLTQVRDYDADIVWIDKHWAQSPMGIGQY